MAKNKKSDLNPYKSLLVNMLYHTWFKKDAITKIADIPKDYIKKYVVK